MCSSHCLNSNGEAQVESRLEEAKTVEKQSWSVRSDVFTEEHASQSKIYNHSDGQWHRRHSCDGQCRTRYIPVPCTAAPHPPQRKFDLTVHFFVPHGFMPLVTNGLWHLIFFFHFNNLGLRVIFVIFMLNVEVKDKEIVRLGSIDSVGPRICEGQFCQLTNNLCSVGNFILSSFYYGGTTLKGKCVGTCGGIAIIVIKG